MFSIVPNKNHLKQSEKETTSVSEPFVFHDIENDRLVLEQHKEILIGKLEKFQDAKILNALNKLKSPNEKLIKKGADEMQSWAIKNNFYEFLDSTNLIKEFYQNLPYKKLENQAARYFIDHFALSSPDNFFF